MELLLGISFISGCILIGLAISAIYSKRMSEFVEVHYWKDFYLVCFYAIIPIINIFVLLFFLAWKMIRFVCKQNSRKIH
jgi:hypothetical protein